MQWGHVKRENPEMTLMRGTELPQAPGVPTKLQTCERGLLHIPAQASIQLIPCGAELPAEPYQHTENQMVVGFTQSVWERPDNMARGNGNGTRGALLEIDLDSDGLGVPAGPWSPNPIPHSHQSSL